MHIEPNTDLTLARDLERHQAPENQDQDEFDRWLAGLGEEARAIVTELLTYGDDEAIVGAFRVAREAGRL